MSIESYTNRWGEKTKIKLMADHYLVNAYRHFKKRRDEMTKKIILSSAITSEIIKMSALISRLRKEIDKRKLIV